MMRAAAEGVFRPIAIMTKHLEASRVSSPFQPSIEVRSTYLAPGSPWQISLLAIDMVDGEEYGFCDAAAQALTAIGPDNFDSQYTARIPTTEFAPRIECSSPPAPSTYELPGEIHCGADVAAMAASPLATRKRKLVSLTGWAAAIPPTTTVRLVFGFASFTPRVPWSKSRLWFLLAAVDAEPHCTIITQMRG